MAQLTKANTVTKYNDTGSGLFKDNTSGDIGADDARALVTDVTDSVPFTSDDSYTWPFPQVTASGTDTYAATTSPAISAYATGQKFQIKFTNASTGVSTLNLNTLGAKKIYTNPTTQATTGDITAAQIYLLIYDAALDAAAGGFLMIGGSGGGGAVDSVNGQTGVVVLDAGDVGADPAGSASTVATNLSNHISDSTDAHDASAISFSATGNIAATDVQAAIVELDGETLNGRAAANTTGVAISFAVPQIYGSVGTPETGNITIVTTGLVQGMTQLLIHNNGTEPTYGAEIQIISGTYTTGVVNYIMLMAVSSTLVLVTISQEIA